MSLSPVVETVIDEWVQLGKPFTAHDVTREVRSRGHRADHDEIRDSVHDYYNRGGFGVDYSRTIISVPTGNPWLYHRIVDDPKTYQNIRGNPTINSVASPAAPVNLSSYIDPNQPVAIPSNLLNNLNGRTNVQNKSGTTKSRVVDARETLSIPCSLIRSVGFKVGQTAFVSSFTFFDNLTQNPAGLVLSGSPALSIRKKASANDVGKYTVDSSNQIRITQAILKKAGLGGNKFDIEELKDEIRVKLSK